MGLAETAQLAVELNLKGNFNAGLTSAEGSLGRFNATAGTAGSKSSFLSNAFAGVRKEVGTFGGAMSHAGNALKGLVTGPLGMIGLAGGLLSVGGAVASTLGKLNDLAFGTEKLTALTGDSAQTVSTLIAATEKYGISLDKLTVTAGFYEKTVGKLNETQVQAAAVGKSAALQHLELVKAQIEANGQSTKTINKLITEQKGRDALTAAAHAQVGTLTKLDALETQYGVHLTDAKGKVLGFSDALLAVADVYSKSTDKSKSATLAATLFGRSYTGLIPILALGRQGILDLETEAAKMGLQLSAANVADFKAYRDAIRGSQEAISGLEVALGEALLPTITNAANALSAFVTSNRTDIVKFFKGAADAAGQFIGIVGKIAGTVGSAWSSIPAPLRDFLVNGIVADRTIKFLFGFSPVGALVSGIEGALSKAVGNGIVTAGLGKLFVQPVFVTNMGAGGLGGGLGNLAGGAEGAAAGAGGLGLAGIAAGIGAILAAYWLPQMLSDHAGGTTQASVNTSVGQMSGSQQQQLNGMLGNIPNATGGFGVALAHAGKAADDLALSLPKLNQSAGKTADDLAMGSASFLKRIQAEAYHFKLGEFSSAKALLKGIEARSAKEHGGKALGQSAIDATFTRDLLHTTKLIQGSSKSTEAKLEALKTLQRTSDGHSAAASAAIKSAINTDTAALRAKRLSVAVAGAVTNVAVYVAGASITTRSVTQAATTRARFQGRNALQAI